MTVRIVPRGDALHQTADQTYAAVALCTEHRERARRWRDHFFNPWHPQEAGGGILMDSRHPPQGVDLSARWDRLNAQQIHLIAEICSRQCPITERRPATPMRVSQPPAQ